MGSDIQRVDESFDKLADKYAGCPPKIMLHSKYERLTDHRNYDERRDLYYKIIAEIEEANENERKTKEHLKELTKQNFKPKEECEAPADEEAAHAEEEPPAEEEAPAEVEEHGGEEVAVDA